MYIFMCYFLLALLVWYVMVAVSLCWYIYG
ncbi:hypothetical protein CPL00168_CDS0067 [Escherichia phage MatMar]